MKWYVSDEYREGGSLILHRPPCALERAHPTGDGCLINLFPPGPDYGRRTPLLNPQYILGRSQEADVVVDRSSVSLQHARLYRDDSGNWWVEDLNSVNGTLVNETRVTNMQLADSDMLRFGDAIFKFLSASNIESAYHEAIHNRADLDGMLGIHNKRYFTDFLSGEIAACLRYGHPLTLVMFDVDHFKRVNDTHGHAAGDAVLKDLAARIRPGISSSQLFARYGGEEFACVLPLLALPDGVRFAEYRRRLIEEQPCVFDGVRIPFTISLGVATLHRETGVDATVLIKRADEKLYIAKAAGRNRVAPSLADLVPT